MYFVIMIHENAKKFNIYNYDDSILTCEIAKLSPKGWDSEYSRSTYIFELWNHWVVDIPIKGIIS